MTVPKQTRRVFLSERPRGHITEATFKNEITDLPTPTADQVVVRVDYVSLDPAMRVWLNGDVTYVPPVQIGETMRGGGVGTVVYGNDQFRKGDTVYGTLGWAEYVVVSAQTLRRLAPPEGFNAIDYLGFWGLSEVGKLKEGDTLVVTAAAGAVGHLVCQIGKLKGARVIAIASGPKCTWLTDELGVDAALDYKSPTFVKEFCETVGHLDVFFDNVGGEILDLALTRLNRGARVVLCGTIATYNADGLEDSRGIKNYSYLIIQRAEVRGFVVHDYKERYREAEAKLVEWVKEGKLKRRYQIEAGLEQCPNTLGCSLAVETPVNYWSRSRRSS
ncbi:alcohol dehydrogenase [Rhizoctonia solani]|nr:alcohol dehydrogenase [Rhizoctonia solani]